MQAEDDVAAALRHAANNLSMVVISNLDLLARGVTPDTPAARQVARAREAAERLLAMLLPYTRLNQAPALEHAAPEAVLQALLPRPALDHALLAWAVLAAAQSPRGTALRIGLAPADAGVALRLSPNPAGAADGLLAVAALVGGSASLGDEMAGLLLPPPYAVG